MRSDGDGDLAQVLLVAGLGVVVLAHGLVIAVVGLADALTGSGRLLGVEEAGDVLRALVTGTRPTGLPAARPLLVAALLLLLGATVALVLAARWHAGRRAARSTSGLARRQDLADLVVPGPAAHRIVLGRAHGRLIATEAEHSVLVVGATRSGKTTGYAIPALLEWDGPAVVLSAKSDLLHATLSVRGERGTTWVYDPTRVSGYPSDRWSPLASCSDWRGAVRTANAMSRVSGTTSGLGGAGKHWERVAAQLLAPMLLAASCGGLDMGHVVQWAMSKELAEAKTLLEVLDEEGELALLSLRSYLQLEPRARDSAFSTVRTVLDAYEDPDVLTTADGWDIRPDLVLDGSATTLYLVANSSDQVRLAPVFLALLDELLREAFLQAARRRASSGSALLQPDGQPAPRLLLLLDEAANIAPLPELATLASTAGGEGIQLVTIYQDLSQVRHRYGTEWGSIVSNHVAKVVLPGITDPETLRYFSSAVGDTEVRVTTSSRGADGRKGSSEHVQRKPVVSERELRELPRGQGLCLYGNRRPIRFALRPPIFGPPQVTRPPARALARGPRAGRRPGAPGDR